MPDVEQDIGLDNPEQGIEQQEARHGSAVEQQHGEGGGIGAQRKDELRPHSWIALGAARASGKIGGNALAQEKTEMRQIWFDRSGRRHCFNALEAACLAAFAHAAVPAGAAEARDVDLADGRVGAALA